jgi:hypothetical protein
MLFLVGCTVRNVNKMTMATRLSYALGSIKNVHKYFFSSLATSQPESLNLVNFSNENGIYKVQLNSPRTRLVFLLYLRFAYDSFSCFYNIVYV